MRSHRQEQRLALPAICEFAKAKISYLQRMAAIRSATAPSESKVESPVRAVLSVVNGSDCAVSRPFKHGAAFGSLGSKPTLAASCSNDCVRHDDWNTSYSRSHFPAAACSVIVLNRNPVPIPERTADVQSLFPDQEPGRDAPPVRRHGRGG